MPEMIAIRQLHGTGYDAGPGQRFTCSEEVAESLAARGLAVYYEEPPAVATYETKVIVPAPVAPVRPPVRRERK